MIKWYQKFWSGNLIWLYHSIWPYVTIFLAACKSSRVLFTKIHSKEKEYLYLQAIYESVEAYFHYWFLPQNNQYVIVLQAKNIDVSCAQRPWHLYVYSSCYIWSVHGKFYIKVNILQFQEATKENREIVVETILQTFYEANGTLKRPEEKWTMTSDTPVCGVNLRTLSILSQSTPITVTLPIFLLGFFTTVNMDCNLLFTLIKDIEAGKHSF